MTKKLACLSRMGLCLNGQEARVAIKNKEEKLLQHKFNDRHYAVRHSSRFCLAWDLVTMTKKLECLSKMGLCHDDQEAHLSVKDGTLSR